MEDSRKYWLWNLRTTVWILARPLMASDASYSCGTLSKSLNSVGLSFLICETKRFDSSFYIEINWGPVVWLVQGHTGNMILWFNERLGWKIMEMCGWWLYILTFLCYSRHNRAWRRLSESIKFPFPQLFFISSFVLFHFNEELGKLKW